MQSRNTPPTAASQPASSWTSISSPESLESTVNRLLCDFFDDHVIDVSLFQNVENEKFENFSNDLAEHTIDTLYIL
jgi:hypothetical protein